MYRNVENFQKRVFRGPSDTVLKNEYFPMFSGFKSLFLSLI